MQHEAFRSGDFNTHFVGKYFSPDRLKETDDEEAMIAAVVAAMSYKKARVTVHTQLQTESLSNWKKNRTNYN
ncbi:hypothetical protein D3C86_2172720 [compost metagenome]